MQLVARPHWKYQQAYEDTNRETYRDGQEAISCCLYDLVPSNPRNSNQAECEDENHCSIVVLFFNAGDHPDVGCCRTWKHQNRDMENLKIAYDQCLIDKEKVDICQYYVSLKVAY